MADFSKFIFVFNLPLLACLRVDERSSDSYKDCDDFFLFKSNERSEDSHIGLADFFFRKQSLKCA